MNKYAAEWLRQADHELETAQFLYDSGRYSLAAFICHLSVEKALKALWQERSNETPPKVHNLLYLSRTLNLEVSRAQLDLFARLNKAVVDTRYPKSLDELQRRYTRETMGSLLVRTREAVTWIKLQL